MAARKFVMCYETNINIIYIHIYIYIYIVELAQNRANIVHLNVYIFCAFWLWPGSLIFSALKERKWHCGSRIKESTHCWLMPRLCSNDTVLLVDQPIDYQLVLPHALS